MNAEDKQAIVIAGGGIGGLTAALALQRAGRRVVVLEQSNLSREIGAGITLAPNSTRALRSLGLLESIRTLADAPNRHIIRHYQTGIETDSFHAGARIEARFGAPFLQIQRSDLHAVLADAVRANDPSSIRLGHRVLGVNQAAEGLVVRIEGNRFVIASALVGADGIHSQIRAQLMGEDSAHFLGYVAWRAIVPFKEIAARGIQAGSELYLGPGRSLLRYTVSNGTLLNCVAFAAKDVWAAESWSVPADPQELLSEFEGWAPEATVVITAMAEGPCFKWGLFGRSALNNWTRAAITLLGDAAHPMLPFLGQGASMAIEDGVVLGRCVENSATAEEAFIRYQRTRFGRATETVARAYAQGMRMHGRADLPQDQFSQPAEAFAAFDYDAGTVTLEC